MFTALLLEPKALSIRCRKTNTDDNNEIVFAKCTLDDLVVRI